MHIFSMENNMLIVEVVKYNFDRKYVHEKRSNWSHDYQILKLFHLLSGAWKTRLRNST